MKTLKDQVVVRAQKTQADLNGYAFWCFDFYHLHYSNYNGKTVCQHSDHLFGIKMQMDRGKGLVLPQAYGATAEDVDLDSYYFQQTLKIFSKMKGGLYGHRSVVKLVRQYPRYFYHSSPSEMGIFVPYEFRHDPAIWVEAMKKGLTPTK